MEDSHSHHEGMKEAFLYGQDTLLSTALAILCTGPEGTFLCGCPDDLPF
jgi:hypothetical protein